jgi:hypothetical protein
MNKICIKRIIDGIRFGCLNCSALAGLRRKLSRSALRLIECQDLDAVCILPVIGSSDGLDDVGAVTCVAPQNPFAGCAALRYPRCNPSSMAR